MHPLVVVVALFVGTTPTFVAKADQRFLWAPQSLEGQTVWTPDL